jgi:hypothetical protein
MLLDLVKFALWLKQKGLKLDELDEKRLKELASEFWDIMHGED